MASFQVGTRIEYGAGVRATLPQEARKLGAGTVLLVSDEGLRKAGLVDQLASILADGSISVVTFTDVEEDPTSLTIDRGAAEARAANPAVVVALGGGSPICAAKGMALVLANGGKLTDYQLGTHKRPPLPIIVLPTTAGSGTEVAPRFLIRDPETGVKRRYGGSDCYARVALLDPELLATLPPRTAIAASLDAMCHAIEAYLSTDANLFTDALALRAIELLSANLSRAALTGDFRAKEAALVASSMANMACGNAKLGLVHGLTYGHLGIPHGLANGIMLPFVLEYLLPACEPRLADVARALGAPLTGRVPADACAAIDAIKDLYHLLDVPRSLAQVGVKETALPELVDVSMKQTHHFDYSIRPARRTDVEDIFRRALAGW